jgi:Cdc6-like AAA superfamily ATPase
MNQKKEFLHQIFFEQNQEDKYKNLHLKFNPFPKSGTANILGSESFNQNLIPVDTNSLKTIVEFLQTAFNDNPLNADDKLAIATITGNYGSGKTQILLFVKSWLMTIADLQEHGKKPYCIYIDNPGAKLLEFIGSIIAKIGEEDFKKFIWEKIITNIKASENYKSRLKKFEYSGGLLFNQSNSDPYSEENSISYKTFLNSFVSYINAPQKRKDFDSTFKNILIEILEFDTGSSTLAQYFYEFISNDFGINKTWEALSSGSIKTLDKKEAEIVRYIVKLIKEQGYTDFFILVDEFEDLTEGRLTKTQIDNYIKNLRILLDEHRDWCLMFAMTGEALRKLRSISPPLADRITGRLINLQDLSDESAKQILLNYLNLAREEATEFINPFDDSGVKKLNELTTGNARKFLKNCYFLIEKATTNLSENESINDNFVEENFLRD